MFKKYLFYTLIIFTNLVFAQSEKWKINSNQSFISYSGNHILHSWEGINNNILGLFVVNSENNISENINEIQSEVMETVEENVEETLDQLGKEIHSNLKK